MEISTQTEENLYHIITLKGELDASSAIILDNAIADANASDQKYVLVDCSELEYISSAGLGVFMSYLRDMEETQGKMVLFSVKESVLEVFQILGLDQLVPIVATKDDAKRLCNEQSM